MAVIEIKNLTKTYSETMVPVHALNGINLEFEKAEFTAIVGPSGCGKTTLLNMMGGLDQPTSGSVIIEAQDITQMKAAALTDFRLHNIGFIFQSYNLIPVLTVKENVEFIMELQHNKKMDINDRVNYLLTTMGMGDKINVRPKYLSGGHNKEWQLQGRSHPGPNSFLQMNLQQILIQNQQIPCWT